MAESRKEHLERLLARYQRWRLDAEHGRDQQGADPIVRALFAGQEQVYAEVTAEIGALLAAYTPHGVADKLHVAAKHLATSASRCRTDAERLLEQEVHPLRPLRTERDVLREQARLFQHAADNLASVAAGRRIVYTEAGALRTAASLRHP